MCFLRKVFTLRRIISIIITVIITSIFRHHFIIFFNNLSIEDYLYLLPTSLAHALCLILTYEGLEFLDVAENKPKKVIPDKFFMDNNNNGQGGKGKYIRPSDILIKKPSGLERPQPWTASGILENSPKTPTSSGIAESSRRPRSPGIAESSRRPRSPNIAESSRRPRPLAIAESSRRPRSPAIAESSRRSRSPAIAESSKRPLSPGVAESSKRPALDVRNKPSKIPSPKVKAEWSDISIYDYMSSKAYAHSLLQFSPPQMRSLFNSPVPPIDLTSDSPVPPIDLTSESPKSSGVAESSKRPALDVRNKPSKRPAPAVMNEPDHTSTPDITLPVLDIKTYNAPLERPRGGRAKSPYREISGSARICKLEHVNELGQKNGLFTIGNISARGNRCTVYFHKDLTTELLIQNKEALEQLWKLFPDPQGDDNKLDKYILGGRIIHDMRENSVDLKNWPYKCEGREKHMNVRYDPNTKEGHYQPWASNIAAAIRLFIAENGKGNIRPILDTESTIFLTTFLNTVEIDGKIQGVDCKMFGGITEKLEKI